MPACLTRKFDGRANVLHSPCRVCEAFPPNPRPDPLPDSAEFHAIWDTGASGTVITQKVVDLLQLKPTGLTNVHGVGGPEITETFMVNVSLPSNVMFHGLRVTKGKLAGDFDILIGMDIIGAGDFAVTNHNGKTVMSYRLPSSSEIDFVKEYQDGQVKALIKNRPNAPRKKNKKKKR